MSAEGWVLIIGAVFAGMGGLLGLWVKWTQDKQRDAIAILDVHISRLQREIEQGQRHLLQKQEAIDELAYLQSRCELREEACYGWMTRAKEHIDRLDAEIQKLGGIAIVSLELPPRSLGADADRAAYLQRRAAYNTALGAALSSGVLVETQKGHP